MSPAVCIACIAQVVLAMNLTSHLQISSRGTLPAADMWLAPRLPSPGPESTTSIWMQSENSFTQDQKIRLVKVSSTAGANSISSKAMLLRGGLCFLLSVLKELQSSTGLHLLHFRSWLPDRPVQLHVPKWCLWMDVQQSPDRPRVRRFYMIREWGKTRDQAFLRDGSSGMSTQR